MLKNKFFGVFGLGISGISTLKFLAKINANFIAYDDNESRIANIKQHYPNLKNNLVSLEDSRWGEIDYLILSPGIPLTFPKPHKVIELCKNAKIISDIEILYNNFPDAYYIGITGTNGKSTTTALIGHILKFNNYDVTICGNIGYPVLDIENVTKKKVFVIETSSFQLDLLDKAKFNIAVLLNITPDHLDRHGSLENYTKSKYKIFNNQNKSDFAIINAQLSHDNHFSTFSETNNNADVFISDNKINFKETVYDLPMNNSLLGKHNQQNLAAAFLCCLKFGLTLEQIIAALPSFIGLKHRMQYLGEHNGVTFINDSKATNADSTEKALNSFRNIIWIVGGIEKEGGITSLKSLFPKVKKALLIGKSSKNFAKTLEGLCDYALCETMENAFSEATKLAIFGDVILLSPACASYDQWKNFEQRGEAFIKLVEDLKKK